MSLELIFPVIIARNAAATIAETLRSLAQFREVLVYDNGSTDDTLRLCAGFPNVRVVEGEFLGFGATKNRAISLARGDWVLSIDADEFIDADLLRALDAADLSDPQVAYRLERCNLFMGRHVKHGGWGNDWLVRLFNRSACRFNDAAVHEKVGLSRNLTVRSLSGHLWHQAISDIDQFLHKISLYSELRRRDGARTHSPLAIYFRSRWAFFSSYVLHLGFLEGWRGLVIANCNAQGTFFRHMKRYVERLDRAAREDAARPGEPSHALPGSALDRHSEPRTPSL